MSEIKDDGGPAFPPAYETDPNDYTKAVYRGLTKRDWFAGQALAGMFNHSGWLNTIDGDHEEAAKRAYAVADAMIAARTESLPLSKGQETAE